MSIVAVGSIAFDTVSSPSGRVEGVLAGALTYFAIAASYFTQVRLVAVVGEDFGPEHEALFKRHRIDIRGVEHAKGKTFRWGGHYLENLNEAKSEEHTSELQSRGQLVCGLLLEKDKHK